MLEITDLRDEDGDAHASHFVAITVVPGSDREGRDGVETSTMYLYPGEPGYDMILSFLAMRDAAELDAASV